MEKSISESEYYIMRIIWDSDGTISSAKLIEKLENQSQPSQPWKRTTVSTFISRLCNKGLISSKRKNGREYYYTALITEEEYNELQTKAFVQKTYNGNAKGLVASLIKNDFLSAEDIDELNRFWHEKADEKNG